MAISIQIISFFVGSSFWLSDVNDYISFAPNMKVNQVLLIAAILLASPTLIQNFYTSFTVKAEEYKGNALKGLMPFIILTVSWYIWLFYSPEMLLETQPVLMFSIYGLVTGFCCTRLVLNRVAAEPCNFFYYILLPIPFIAFYSLNHSLLLFKPFFSEMHIVYGYLVWISFFYYHMIFNVINEITECLDIYCLTIKRKINKN